jgi:Holliday junction resolvase
LTDHFEGKIARIFRQKGYYTVISAGSRGVADVVAIKAHELLFIQCKRHRNLSINERRKLADTASFLNAKPLIATHKRGRILVKEI